MPHHAMLHRDWTYKDCNYRCRKCKLAKPWNDFLNIRVGICSECRSKRVVYED